MTRILRQVSKKFFIVSNIAAVVVFLLVCCTGFLSPGRYWYIAMLGVGFPFIVLALLLFIFFWWFFKSRWAFLSLVTLIIGWSQVHALFGLHLFNSFDIAKPAGALRVMQWNVSRLDQMNPKRPGGSYRIPILEYIKKTDPDVVCLEEFLESNNPREFNENIPYFTNVLKYPYHFFARDHRRWDGVYEHGVVIFSRYPILDTLRIRYSGPDSLKAAESLIHADIDVNGQRIRVFATHLQSLRFDINDYTVIRTLAKGENDAVNKSKGVLKKFRLAYYLRSKQAELVRREKDDSPYPTIICGDFNDVPNSFTYARIKGDCNDAFLQYGFGIGRSFASLSPTLRIDYIFTDKKLEVLQFKNTKLRYSDHYPLLADVKLPSKE
ncbi:MAG TPA: endonuclease/exonuclease/phosphatase family protein [Chitinophagaceae bacterium]|nr:endonuclease/exonuclease/phosphatase family protein [Chitinophagaceae bacterium]